MSTFFAWILALHVLAIISWMCGILYLYRLYVYHAMEVERVVMERFQVMERRLLRGIANPAMVVALLTGIAMLALNPALLREPWMHIKLALVLGMFASHGIASSYRKKLIENPYIKSDKFFRVMNEIPTLLMIGIVIAVIVKPFGH
jgi:putative membrane protein